jgi:hypothetical protein
MASAEKTIDQIRTRQVIVPTGQRLGYVEAFNLVRDKGGLPSNVLHDDILVRSEGWKQLQGYYPAWAREVLVYPEKNGVFKRGQDIIDGQWVFPASFIPELAIGQEKVGLFVDLQNVEASENRVVILAEPKSVIVLAPFIQNSGELGKVDEATRVPLYVEKDERQFLTEDQKRWLWRIDGQAVRPLVRGWVAVSFDNRRIVYADFRPYDSFGMGLVRREAA